MYKIVTIAALLAGLALAPVLAGMGLDLEAPELGPAPIEAAPPVRALPSTEVVEATAACEWSCRACEDGEGCRQLCTEIGDCGSSCGVTARCDAQHVWDESTCTCVGH